MEKNLIMWINIITSWLCTCDWCLYWMTNCHTLKCCCDLWCCEWRSYLGQTVLIVKYDYDYLSLYLVFDAWWEQCWWELLHGLVLRRDTWQGLLSIIMVMGTEYWYLVTMCVWRYWFTIDYFVDNWLSYISQHQRNLFLDPNDTCIKYTRLKHTNSTNNNRYLRYFQKYIGRS